MSHLEPVQREEILSINHCAAVSVICGLLPPEKELSQISSFDSPTSPTTLVDD